MHKSMDCKEVLQVILFHTKITKIDLTEQDGTYTEGAVFATQDVHARVGRA